MLKRFFVFLSAGNGALVLRIARQTLCPEHFEGQGCVGEGTSVRLWPF
jgi:hypothetical protein